LLDQSVSGPGAEISPYLFNDRYAVNDGSLEFERRLGSATLGLQYEVREEALTTDFVSPPAVATPGPVPVPAPLPVPGRPAHGRVPATPAEPLLLGETARTLSLRYSFLPVPSLRLGAAAEYSALSPFGAQLDPRVSAVWTADTRTSARLTVGTAYQPPPLQELVVPDPLPNVSGGYVAVGNPNLKPVQATEYDLGVERTFGASSATRLSADVYRSNLRAPVYYLIPPLEPRCGLTSVAGKEPCPLSYPVNAGDGVDRGLELALRQQLSNDTSVRASYAVHSSYLSSSPPAIQDGSLVEGQQTLGLPLHRAVVTLAGTPPRGFVYGASLAYEGAYNALNQPPYATLAARAGYRFNAGYELDIAGTNLTNVYDQRFTKTGSGVPYGGIAAPVGTDAYALQGTAFLMTLTRRF
jgi:outer membrane receptor protein involved in Fe transport